MKTYLEWFRESGDKHNNLYKKLVQRNLSPKKIIEYFRWENMVEAQPNFCVLYAENKKCHDTPELNCFFCGCPNFRINLEESDIKSFCGINSPQGKQSTYNGITHQNCTDCLVPHKEKYIEEHFTYDWFDAMKECKHIG